MNIYSFIFGQNNISSSGTFIVINLTATGQKGRSRFNLSNTKISDPKGNLVNINVRNASLDISPPTSNITFFVTDIYSGKIIQGATVSLDGIAVKSNLKGEANFSKVTNGVHEFSVNAKNYIFYQGLFTLTGDLRKNIKLTPRTKGNR